MYCIECGKELIQDAKFCPYCGTQVTKVFKSQENSLQKPNEASDTNMDINPVNKEYERLHQMYIYKPNEELLEIINPKNGYSNTAVLVASDILRTDRGINDGLPDRRILLSNENKQTAIQNAPYNTMCILGMVISCISLFLNFWGIAGIDGVIISVVGIMQTQRKQENGKILAIIGIIIGCYSIFYAFNAIMKFYPY